MFNAQYFRTFITLVETGSFTQTAKQLDMTQPGVSQHIIKLERYLKKSLLTRHGRRFTLTETGRRAHDYALKLFAEHEQFRHSLDDNSLDCGECRIASPPSIGLMLYPFMLGYQQMHPGITVSYHFASNAEIAKDLIIERYDLGVVTETVKHPKLDYLLWHQEPLCLVVPADFSGTRLADLLGLGMIHHPEGINNASSLLKANFSDEFRSMDYFPRQGFTNAVSLALDAVARGLGFCVVSRLVLETSPWQREVKALTLAQTVYESFYLAMPNGSEIPRRYTRMLEEFREQRQQSVVASQGT